MTQVQEQSTPVDRAIAGVLEDDLEDEVEDEVVGEVTPPPAPAVEGPEQHIRQMLANMAPALVVSAKMALVQGLPKVAETLTKGLIAQLVVQYPLAQGAVKMLVPEFIKGLVASAKLSLETEAQDQVSMPPEEAAAQVMGCNVFRDALPEKPHWDPKAPKYWVSPKGVLYVRDEPPAPARQQTYVTNVEDALHQLEQTLTPIGERLFWVGLAVGVTLLVVNCRSNS